LRPTPKPNPNPSGQIDVIDGDTVRFNGAVFRTEVPHPTIEISPTREGSRRTTTCESPEGRGRSSRMGGMVGSRSS
jgi:hypothetical protein